MDEPAGNKSDARRGAAPAGAGERDPRAWAEHVRKIRDDGDQKAFAEVYRHFAPRMKAFLMRSGAGDAQAEDCVQEAMATMWRKAHLFDPSRASVSTWLFTIARNQRVDALRRERRPEPEELTWGPEAAPDQSDVVAFQQEAERLGAAVAALPEAQRQAVERAFWGDESHGRIAADTGLPLGTIKSRIRMALRRLRRGYDADDDDGSDTA